jgi:hypothetical protein
MKAGGGETKAMIKAFLEMMEASQEKLEAKMKAYRERTEANQERWEAVLPLSCERARPCSGCLSLPRKFIDLVYSQFELTKIKLQKVNYFFLLFLGVPKFNVSCGPLSKIAAPLPGLPKQTNCCSEDP